LLHADGRHIQPMPGLPDTGRSDQPMPDMSDLGQPKELAPLTGRHRLAPLRSSKDIAQFKGGVESGDTQSLYPRSPERVEAGRFCPFLLSQRERASELGEPREP